VLPQGSVESGRHFRKASSYPSTSCRRRITVFMHRGKPRLEVRPQQPLSFSHHLLFLQTSTSAIPLIILTSSHLADQSLAFSFDLRVYSKRYPNFVISTPFLNPDPPLPVARSTRPKPRSSPSIYNWLLKPPNCLPNVGSSPWYAALPHSTCLDLATCCPPLEFTCPTSFRRG
jgi:hypothetical protein